MVFIWCSYNFTLLKFKERLIILEVDSMRGAWCLQDEGMHNVGMLCDAGILLVLVMGISSVFITMIPCTPLLPVKSR